MNIIDIDVAALTPYENNPRDNDGAVEAVANSIKEFGFKVPIIIDKDNVIVAGHTRLKAAKELGYKRVPCIIADDLTEEQLKAFRLVDNKTAELATWDFEKLDLELSELPDLDMSLYGFSSLKPVDSTDDETNNTADTGFNYKEQYGVIVMCQDEAEQEDVYNRLTEEGFECKVVAT